MPSPLPLLLIVDDNPENLTVVGELLQPHYRVRAANTGPRALRLAALAPQPELILLDVMMPDMDGHEVLSRLRADPQTSDIPVVFLTALDSTADEERGLQLGAADYITKPIRPTVLLARVRLQLELRQARDRLLARNRLLEAEDRAPVHDPAALPAGDLARYARALEHRDPSTAKHLQRCQAYMGVLTRHLLRQSSSPLTLDGDLAEHLVRSAALHDIGIGTMPQHVLRLVGDPSTDEAQALRDHARLGSELFAQAEQRMLRELQFLRTARLMARHHHERWDGGGYPDRLSGADIPLPARLMAVLGSFDALVWPGGGLPGATIEAAREQLRHGRATKFDPAVLDACEACFDELAAIAAGQRIDDWQVASS